MIPNASSNMLEIIPLKNLPVCFKLPMSIKGLFSAMASAASFPFAIATSFQCRRVSKRSKWRSKHVRCTMLSFSGFHLIFLLSDLVLWERCGFSCIFPKVFSPSCAFTTVMASDVPCLDNAVLDFAAAPAAPISSSLSDGSKKRLATRWKPYKGFLALGHRGSGMNKAVSAPRRMQEIMENSILSFNTAAARGVSFIEFDVQVTKDGCAVIFHDDFIVTKVDSLVVEKRIDELTLNEFFSYGLQKDGLSMQKPLSRKAKDGRFHDWTVSVNDSLCSLREAFQKVDPSVGFNIELKFDDDFQYPEEILRFKLEAVLKEVYESANGRQIFFSSFHPDAALIFRKMQSDYPVLFLTNGGIEEYRDPRRNSLEAAIQLCIAGELQGIVSEVKAILRHPALISDIKDLNLCLLTYGQLNNATEIVHLQYLLGIDGVIVDLVENISAAISSYALQQNETADSSNANEEETQLAESPNPAPPSFSSRELSFIMKLIPHIIQN